MILVYVSELIIAASVAALKESQIPTGRKTNDENHIPLNMVQTSSRADFSPVMEITW